MLGGFGRKGNTLCLRCFLERNLVIRETAIGRRRRLALLAAAIVVVARLAAVAAAALALATTGTLRTLALTASPRLGAACLAGPHRLAGLGPLLRFARGLRVYSPALDAQSRPTPSAWELDLGTARFTLTLSPENFRGFSGEGALLETLADDSVTADADLIGVLLAWSPRIDIGRISAQAGLSDRKSVV